MKTMISNDHGVVIKKVYSQYLINVGGHTHPCATSTIPHNKKTWHGSIAVGDKVRIINNGNGNLRIIDVLPRRNQFSRPAPNTGMHIDEQVIAANVDLIVPIFSIASPIPKWGLLDRYLAAAEAEGLPSLICFSKSDLAPLNPDLEEALDEYRSIGYQVVLVSTLTGAGIPELIAAIQDRVSVFVGKSGVGKTSLLNALQPGLGLRVQPTTQGRKGKGRHTTTHLEMFPLDFEGAVIDTPGIREFGLWDIYADELAEYFREMRPFVGSCRFGLDCHHDEEPGCAIRKAVMAGAISHRRYRSYMRLREELP